MGDYDAPTADEFRTRVLPDLYNSVQLKVSRELNEFIEDTDVVGNATVNETLPHVTAACAVELWPCSTMHGAIQSTPSVIHHANLELHCSQSTHTKRKLQSRVLRAITVSTRMRVFTVCFVFVSSISYRDWNRNFSLAVVF